MGCIANTRAPLSRFETVETWDSPNEALAQSEAMVLREDSVDGLKQRVGCQGLAQKRLKAELSQQLAVLH